MKQGDFLGITKPQNPSLRASSYSHIPPVEGGSGPQTPDELRGDDSGSLSLRTDWAPAVRALSRLPALVTGSSLPRLYEAVLQGVRALKPEFLASELSSASWSDLEQMT